MISLLTDFGTQDGYVGTMKGVMLGICPTAQLVDISHGIRAQDVQAAGFVLQRAAWTFPAGTVHLAVVDPDVGTGRRPVAARIGEHYFVAPDNGLLTLLLEHAGKQGWTWEAVEADKRGYWRDEVSDTFHGRDIFAPVAAHLAAGVALSEIGTALTDLVRIDTPRATRTATGWQGEVVYIDQFGNIVSNITREELGTAGIKVLRLNSTAITQWVRTFGEAEVGTLVAQYSSHGHVEVAVVNGDAAARLGATVGDMVEVEVEVEE
jgi:hypothetical protein